MNLSAGAKLLLQKAARTGTLKAPRIKDGPDRSAIHELVAARLLKARSPGLFEITQAGCEYLEREGSR